MSIYIVLGRDNETGERWVQPNDRGKSTFNFPDDAHYLADERNQLARKRNHTDVTYTTYKLVEVVDDEAEWAANPPRKAKLTSTDLLRDLD